MTVLASKPLTHQAVRGPDNALQAMAARLTSGRSPISLALAQADWLMHLATQPTQPLQLAAVGPQPRRGPVPRA